MSKVLAIDLETKNLSHEIGGWGNTHMFLVSTVCTYVLRDSLDIFCITKYMKEQQYIDTSKYLVKEFGERFSLENLVNHNFGETKQLESIQAPALWKSGEYQSVVDYCVDDCKLVHKLWVKGQDEMIKAFSLEKEEEVEMEVRW